MCETRRQAKSPRPSGLGHRQGESCSPARLRTDRCHPPGKYGPRPMDATYLAGRSGLRRCRRPWAGGDASGPGEGFLNEAKRRKRRHILTTADEWDSDHPREFETARETTGIRSGTAGDGHRGPADTNSRSRIQSHSPSCKRQSPKAERRKARAEPIGIPGGGGRSPPRPPSLSRSGLPPGSWAAPPWTGKRGLPRRQRPSPGLPGL